MRLRRIIRNDQLILSILAVFVGAAAGGGVIAIRELIDFIQGVFLAGTSENLISSVTSLHWAQILFAPAIGGLMIGLFIHYFIPGRKPRSVAKVIEASALQDVIKDGLNRREDSASISVYRATHRLWALHQLALWSKTFSVSI